MQVCGCGCRRELGTNNDDNQFSVQASFPQCGDEGCRGINECHKNSLHDRASTLLTSVHTSCQGIIGFRIWDCLRQGCVHYLRDSLGLLILKDRCSNYHILAWGSLKVEPIYVLNETVSSAIYGP